MNRRQQGRQRRVRSGSAVPIWTTLTPSFWIDANAIATLRKSSAAAVDGQTVDAWNDRSANARNASQGTGAAQGLLDTFGLNGCPALILSGSQFMALSSLTLSPCTYIAVWRSSTAGIVYEHGANVPTTNGAMLSSTSANSLTVNGAGGTSAKDVSANWATDNAPRITRHSCNGTHATHLLSVNRVSQSLSSVTANDPGAIGAGVLTFGARTAGTSGITGALGFIAGWNRILTSAELDTVEGYIQSAWRFPTAGAPQTVNIACQGDSITAGSGVSASFAYPARLGVTLGSKYGTPANVGVNGQTVAQMITSAPGSVDTLLSGTKTNVVLGLGGINDIITDGASANTLLTRITSWCSARRTAGWRVVWGTMLADGAITQGGAQDTVRTTVNAALRASPSTYGIDVLFDPGAESAVLGNYSVANAAAPWFQADKLHPTAIGYERLSGVVAGTVLGMGL